MGQLVFNYEQVINDQIAILQTLAIWQNSFICLTKSSFPALPIPPLADLIAAEADFPNYVRAAAVPGFSQAFPTGVWSGNYSLWWRTGSASPQNVYNYFWVDVTGTELLAFGVIDGAPWPMLKDLDSLTLQYGLSLMGGISQTGF